MPVTCHVISESNTVRGFNCIFTDQEANGTSMGMELNINNIIDIGGIPDYADPSKLHCIFKYNISSEYYNDICYLYIESIDIKTR